MRYLTRPEMLAATGAGGLLDAARQVVFSRAEHAGFGSEVDFWISPKPDFPKLRLPPEGVLAVARQARGGIRVLHRST